jgi:arylsulfatase
VAQHPNAPSLPGRSLVPVFDTDGAVDRDFLFFHHEGNRALRVGDYKLVAAKENGDTWELYDLGEDRSETVDRATQQPDRIEELKGLWEELDNSFRQQAGPP